MRGRRPLVLAGPGAATVAAQFEAAGLEVRVLPAPGAAALRELDADGVRYLLVHVGADDGEAGGSHERAHHRVSVEEAPGLAARLRPRGRRLVTCLAFGYRHGMPEEATWLVDVRFLDNPFWVEDLRPLDGRDPAVAGFVLGQPAALELLDRLEATIRWSLPLYQRDHLVVAFGCTGGRHRSVAMAEAMAARLAAGGEVEVELRHRELG